MRKLNAIFILIVFTLCACGQVRADVPDNPEAKATQNIVEEYIIANEDYDADLLVGLYSDKLVYFDYGMSIGPINKGNLDYFIHETMAARDFKLHVKSYNVTPDGRFAAMVAEYSEKSALTGKWASVDCIAVLEIKDSKIINEIWYYNGDALH